jgi:hypothetical protein
MGDRKEPNPAPGEPGYKGPPQVRPAPPPAPPAPRHGAEIEPAHRIALRIARRACSGYFGEGQIAFEIEEAIREARAGR